MCYFVPRKSLGFSAIAFLMIASPQFCMGAGASVGKAFNPDISVNFLGLFRKSNINAGDLIGRTSDVHNGFTFQEAEMQFFADVDPYFRANALFSLSRETKISNVDLSQTPPLVMKDSGFGLDPEEVFFETISLPVMTFRVGKFKAALGKHNILHTHAYPFIDAPLINQDVLGGEGLNETGVSASALVPTPWFLELTGQVFSNSNSAIYNSPNSGDITGVVQLKNLWDLSDEMTLEWSVFGTQGKNAAMNTAQAYGSDFIIKWRPVEGGKYRALVFANEYLAGSSPGTGFTVGPSNNQSTGEHLGGFASWLQYQFAERWWLQGRVEFESLQQVQGNLNCSKQSVLLALNPSEFSGFRLQYDHIMADNQEAEHAVTLQWNITIGAHPAHSY